MTTKTISWFVGGYVQTTPHEGASRFGAGQVYTLDKAYYPKALRLYLGTAPTNQAVVLDIQDDGVTIFRDYRTSDDIQTQYPQVDKGANSKATSFFTADGRVRIDKDSVLTLEIRQTGSDARNLTVELDLEEA